MKEEELKKLAVDIVNGKVFTSLHLEGDDMNLLGHIFTPCLFGALEEIDTSNLGLIYEYLDKAGPRSINGYPTFFSMKILSMADNEKLFEYMNKYRELMKKL